MKKYKYIVPVGTRIWFRTDATTQPYSNNGEYVEVITEQKMVLDESDLLVRGHLEQSDMMYLIFRLSKNNCGYNGFEVWEDDVTVVEE